MLTVEVELLAGHYVATHFNDRDRAEWPVHPARLFAAFVAAWADADQPSEKEANALRALEAAGAPTIVCDADSKDIRRSVVTHFVPDNDVRALSRDLSAGYQRIDQFARELAGATLTEKDRTKTTIRLEKERDRLVDATAKAGASTGKESADQIAEVLKVLPDERGKQGRTYPTVVPPNPRITFRWDTTLAPEDITTLDAIASRISRIGHSSSLVDCRVTSVSANHLDDRVRYVATESLRSSTSIRVPRVGMFDRLVHDYARHQASEPRITPSHSARYVRADAQDSEPTRSNLAGRMIVLPWAAGTRPPRMAKTLALTTALRGALLRYGAQPSPSVLSGHTSRDNATTPTDALQGPHVAFVALPWCIDEFADGSIRGLGLVLPTEISDADQALVLAALRAFSGAADGAVLRTRVGRFDLARNIHGQRPAALNPDRWREPSTTWVTVTPIALDRYAKRPDDVPEIIAESCRDIGLPIPTEVVATRQPLARGTAHVRDFPGFSSNPSRPTRASMHARLTFATPVSGPLLIGAGRYFGYGLCAPIEVTP